MTRQRDQVIGHDDGGKQARKRVHSSIIINSTPIPVLNSNINFIDST